MIINRNDIIKLFLESDVMKKWHWFQYHFNLYHSGIEHNLCDSLTTTLFELQKIIPLIHEKYIKKIASISGIEKHQDHYDQLIQVLAELIIIRQILRLSPNGQFEYEYEPHRGNSNKNPELLVKHKQCEIGIEVKCPSILKYSSERQKSIQLPSRNPLMMELDYIKKARIEHQLTLPKDNVVKDFMISTNNKFKEFKLQNGEFIGVLVIVWDDFIYEPISALLNKFTGILTSNSYVKENGDVMKFENIDFIIITSHINQIRIIAGDYPIPFDKKFTSLLDYGSDYAYPYIKNHNSHLELPDFFTEQLQLKYITDLYGAGYNPIDIIWWV